MPTPSQARIDELDAILASLPDYKLGLDANGNECVLPLESSIAVEHDTAIVWLSAPNVPECPTIHAATSADVQTSPSNENAPTAVLSLQEAIAANVSPAESTYAPQMPLEAWLRVKLQAGSWHIGALAAVANDYGYWSDECRKLIRLWIAIGIVEHFSLHGVRMYVPIDNHKPNNMKG